MPPFISMSLLTGSLLAVIYSVFLFYRFINAFGENHDSHIDFKEISCGLSACCRGPLAETQKFCFKVFDVDGDGVLSRVELRDTWLHI